MTLVMQPHDLLSNLSLNLQPHSSQLRVSSTLNPEFPEHEKTIAPHLKF